MGSEVCVDELMHEENPAKILLSTSKLPSVLCCDIIESKNNNVALLSQSPESVDCHKLSIGPVTPDSKRENADSKRENADQNHDILSPLTFPSSPLQAPCSYSTRLDESSDGNGLETPKETLFDSFAPGPDKFMLAPLHQKYREELRNHVVRRLNFNCATNLDEDFSCEAGAETSPDEVHLFEIVYETILDAIFSEQSKELELDIEYPSQSLEGPRTPKSARILSGVAETCPGAPMKTSSKSRNIDREICKKLF